MKKLWTLHKIIFERYNPTSWDDLPLFALELKHFSPTIVLLTSLNADNFLKERYFPANGFYCHVEELCEIVRVNDEVVDKFPEGKPRNEMLFAMVQCKW